MGFPMHTFVDNMKNCFDIIICQHKDHRECKILTPAIASGFPTKTCGRLSPTHDGRCQWIAHAGEKLGGRNDHILIDG